MSLKGVVLIYFSSRSFVTNRVRMKFSEVKLKQDVSLAEWLEGRTLITPTNPKCSRVNTLVVSGDTNEYSVFIALYSADLSAH